MHCILHFTLHCLIRHLHCTLYWTVYSASAPHCVAFWAAVWWTFCTLQCVICDMCVVCSVQYIVCTLFTVTYTEKCSKDTTLVIPGQSRGQSRLLLPAAAGISFRFSKFWQNIAFLLHFQLSYFKGFWTCATPDTNQGLTHENTWWEVRRMGMRCKSDPNFWQNVTFLSQTVKLWHNVTLLQIETLSQNVTHWLQTFGNIGSRSSWQNVTL